jgi:hypothetical protein
MCRIYKTRIEKQGSQQIQTIVEYRRTKRGKNIEKGELERGESGRRTKVAIVLPISK